MSTCELDIIRKDFDKLEQHFDEAIKEVMKQIDKVDDEHNGTRKEISTNKEKYMPAVTLINQLNVDFKALKEDLNSKYVHLTTTDSTLSASTQSAHKRLDNANKVVEKLEGMPEMIRKDFMKLGGAILVLMIGFGVWIENSITEIRIKQGMFEIQIAEIREQARENALNNAKTYQNLKELLVKLNDKRSL